MWQHLRLRMEICNGDYLSKQVERGNCVASSYRQLFSCEYCKTFKANFRLHNDTNNDTAERRPIWSVCTCMCIRKTFCKDKNLNGNSKQWKWIRNKCYFLPKQKRLACQAPASSAPHRRIQHQRTYALELEWVACWLNEDCACNMQYATLNTVESTIFFFLIIFLYFLFCFPHLSHVHQHVLP